MSLSLITTRLASMVSGNQVGKDGTHKIGLSRTTALLDLSLTFPLDHFFFLLRAESALMFWNSSLILFEPDSGFEPA